MAQRSNLCVTLASAVLITTTVIPAQAQVFADKKTSQVDYSRADIEPHKACDALGQYKAKDIKQIAAAMKPAAGAVPAFCDVTGLLGVEIAFEFSLPSKWNGRFYMIGNGGPAGEALDAADRVAQRNDALQQGFAFAQTNTGHDARKEPGDTFVLSSPEKAIDYAYRAVHLTASVGKDITKDYYGKTARGPAISGRFRRHYCQCPMGRSDRLHDWRYLESEGNFGDTHYQRKNGNGGGQSHGQM